MTSSHQFTATRAGIHEDEDCLVATLDSGADSYLMFQRHPELGHPDDDGVYVEIDDQINAGFNIVERCVVTPTDVIVDLKNPLKGYVELHVTFDMPNEERAEFQTMLRRIFDGCSDLLVMDTSV